jgi:hypothetical protein
LGKITSTQMRETQDELNDHPKNTSAGGLRAKYGLPHPPSLRFRVESAGKKI